MTRLVDCPGCQGTGEKTLRVSDCTGSEVKDGKVVLKTGPVKEVPIRCFECGGRAKITPREANAIRRQYEQYREMMCSCGNPSGQTAFHDDETHPQCRKHCWTCNDCGKIVQIG